MLFYSFKNYGEFKELFPIEKMNNGKSVRRNAMLLNFYKSKGLLHDAVSNRAEFPDVRNVAQMEVFIKDELAKELCMRHGGFNVLRLAFTDYASSVYALDDKNGICDDDDAKSIRYILVETGKVYKMKATKFFSKILNEYSCISKLNPAVVNYYASDVLAKQWEAYATEEIQRRNPEMCELHIDDNFRKIYARAECAGDFGSCMTNNGQYDYYKNAVSAKAAYMTNVNGLVVARAIIFTDVTDEDGNKYRLCERQYSVDGDDTKKRILVNKLIAAGEIDGYKKIGASCHATTSYVSNNGEDWSSKKFQIECNLEDGDILSYQDSFIYYDMDENIAYNHEPDFDVCRLNTTSRRFHNGQEYDSYHDEYCEEVVDVYYHGHHETCDVDDLDDFVWCEDGSFGESYYHEDDVNYDDYHQCYTANGVESVYYDGRWIDCDKEDLGDFTYCEDGPDGEGYYHCDDVRYDEYNKEDTACECVEVHVHGERMMCSVEKLEDFVEIDDEYYHEDDVCECYNCGETILKEDACTSELPELEGKYFCDEDCLEEAEDEVLAQRESQNDEQTYNHQGMEFAEIDNKWIPESEITRVYVVGENNILRKATISQQRANAESYDLEVVRRIQPNVVVRILFNERVHVGATIWSCEHLFFGREYAKLIVTKIENRYITIEFEGFYYNIESHEHEVA